MYMYICIYAQPTIQQPAAVMWTRPRTDWAIVDTIYYGQFIYRLHYIYRHTRTRDKHTPGQKAFTFTHRGSPYIDLEDLARFVAPEQQHTKAMAFLSCSLEVLLSLGNTSSSAYCFRSFSRRSAPPYPPLAPIRLARISCTFHLHQNHRPRSITRARA